MDWKPRPVKIVVDEESGQRYIYLQGEKSKLRILTEDAIDKMGDHSFKLYRQKIAAWNDRIHEGGTPDAIKAIDFLRHAIERSQRERRKNEHA